MNDTPAVVESSAQRAAVIRLTVPREELPTVMGPAIHEVIGAVAAQGIGPTGPVFAHYFRVEPVFEFEVGVPVSGAVTPVGRVVASELPEATVARTVYTGPYEGLGAAWGEFEAWMKAHGHVGAPDLWERYVVGPESGPDASKWQTELNRPLVSGAAEGTRA
jgi:effector-binding domain-containing protein